MDKSKQNSLIKAEEVDRQLKSVNELSDNLNLKLQIASGIIDILTIAAQTQSALIGSDARIRELKASTESAIMQMEAKDKQFSVRIRGIIDILQHSKDRFDKLTELYSQTKDKEILELLKLIIDKELDFNRIPLEQLFDLHNGEN